VLYDPTGPEPQAEWVEIYNAGGLPITLNGYKIGDAAAPGDLEGMFLLPDGLTLQAGQVLVIANHALQFALDYGSSPDFELSDSDEAVTSLPRYTAWADRQMQLAAAGDEVLLLDAGDIRVDGVSWGDSLEFFYPAAPRVHEGCSIERMPANQDTDSAADWREQPDPIPGEALIPTLTPTPTRSPMPTPTATSTATPYRVRAGSERLACGYCVWHAAHFFCRQPSPAWRGSRGLWRRQPGGRFRRQPGANRLQRRSVPG
jgi:hypothetical protein